MKIGIDLGGTKIEIICLDNDRVECYRHRIPSPQNSYTDTINVIVDLVAQAELSVNQSKQSNFSYSIGIGIPGSINPKTYLVRNSNSTWLNGKPFLKDIRQALNSKDASREVYVENDANCFVLSEALDGAAQGKLTVFGVIVGTGCGGGLFLNNQLVVGVNGLGGEWGHNPLPFPQVFSSEQHEMTSFFEQVGVKEPSEIYSHKENVSMFSNSREDSEYPGPLCYCGKRGCIETWISGPALSNDYQRVTHQSISANDIVALSDQGNSTAKAVLARYCERLAKSLAQVINVYDPEIIVLGGGMSNVDLLYTEIPKRWDKYTFPDEFTTTMVKAHHGDSSGVRGAALLSGLEK